MTKKEMFAEIRNRVADNAEMVAFIDHEIELLNRKRSASSKPTKNQIANESIKNQILYVLASAEEGYSATDIATLVGNGVSCQKVSALLKQLVKAESVIRKTEGDKVKGKAIYSLA